MYHHDNPDSRNDCVLDSSVSIPLAGSSAGSQGLPSEDSIPVKPPLTNRGALITIPLVNRFLIDWAAFTFKLTDPHQVIEILCLKQSLFTELERGMHGYRKSLRYGNIGIYFDGQENMGCHVSMSGQGCRQYESQFAESPWFNLFTAALSHRATFTRLDLAHDNVAGELDLTALKTAITNNTIRSRFRNASENTTFSLSRNESPVDDGRTIYFGKRSSRVYMRFYDKAAQMGTPLPWNRAEIELKDKRAQKSVELLVSGLPIGQLFVGIVNEYLTIINLDDSNISRCSVQSWWIAWLQSTEKIRLTTAKEVKSIEEVMEYVKKQYAPTLAMIKTHLGVVPFRDYMNELIKDGTDRMNMKHEQMLFLSAQKLADNYNQDREDFEERASIIEFDGNKERKTAEAITHLLLDHKEEPQA